jgi:hypothetical protein
MEVWRDVLQPPIDSDALRQPRQRGTQQGVPLDVDLFAASKTPFEILGENTGGTEPINCRRDSEHASKPP